MELDHAPSVPVARADLHNLSQLVSELVEPMVLRGLDLTAGQGSLTPQVLASRLTRLDGSVDHSRSPVLMYYKPSKPLAKVRGFDAARRGITSHWNLSAAELLDRLDRAAAHHAWERAHNSDADGRCAAEDYWYYAAPNGTNAVALARELLRLDQLEAASGGEAHSVNLWVGGGGVTSHCHYDASLNLFAQLHGHKHFLLVAPEAAPALQAFSFLHPHFRRSQRAPEEVAAAVPARSAQRWFSQALLGPGDLLALPPFYFHHVRAASAVSISVNLWASVGPVLAAQQLIGRGGEHFGLVPLGLQSQARRCTATQLLTRSGPVAAQHARPGGLLARPGLEAGEQLRAALVEAVAQRVARATLALASVDAARRWTDDAMRTRWAPVRARYPKALAKLERFCEPVFYDAREAMWRGAVADAEPELQRAVDSAAATLRALPAGAVEMELGNLVEEVAFDVFQAAKTVGSFLTLCFRGGSAEGEGGKNGALARKQFEEKYNEGDAAR